MYGFLLNLILSFSTNSSLVGPCSLASFSHAQPPCFDRSFNFFGFAQALLRKTGQITSLSTNQSAVFALCHHNIDVQSVSSWAPKVVRKCESKHWLSCGADGRRSVVGVRSRDYQFVWDGWITLAMGLRPRARITHARSSAIIIIITIFVLKKRIALVPLFFFFRTQIQHALSLLFLSADEKRKLCRFVSSITTPVKECAARAKLLLLIRAIVVFHRFPALHAFAAYHYTILYFV